MPPARNREVNAFIGVIVAVLNSRAQNLSWPCDSTESGRQRLWLSATVTSNRCERCCSCRSLRPAVGSPSVTPGPATDPTHSPNPARETLLVFSKKQAEHRLHPRFFDHRWSHWRDRRVMEYLHPCRCRADGDVSPWRRNPPQAAPATLRSELHTLATRLGRGERHFFAERNANVCSFFFLAIGATGLRSSP